MTVAQAEEETKLFVRDAEKLAGIRQQLAMLHEPQVKSCIRLKVSILLATQDAARHVDE